MVFYKFMCMIEKNDFEGARQIMHENPGDMIHMICTPLWLPYPILYLPVVRGCRELTYEIMKFLQTAESHDLSDYHRRNKPLDIALIDHEANGLGCPKGNTVLHLAAEYGHLDIIADLLEFWECKILPNAEGKYPHEVICKYVSDDKKNEQKISAMSDLLNRTTLVPLLRYKNNMLPAVVGEPIFRNDMLKYYGPDTLPSDRELKAFMLADPNTADRLYNRWKSTSENPSLDKHLFSYIVLKEPSKGDPHVEEQWRQDDPERFIRLTDATKGLETVGRLLVKGEKASWYEYWEFCDGFCELTKTNSLRQLEIFFKHRIEQAVEANRQNPKQIPKTTEYSQDSTIDSITENLIPVLSETNQHILNALEKLEIKKRIEKANSQAVDGNVSKKAPHDHSEATTSYFLTPVSSIDQLIAATKPCILTKEFWNAQMRVEIKRRFKQEKAQAVEDAKANSPIPPVWCIVELIDRTNPSNMDTDIWNALDGLEFKQSEYPNIYLWHNTMKRLKPIFCKLRKLENICLLELWKCIYAHSINPGSTDLTILDDFFKIRIEQTFRNEIANLKDPKALTTLPRDITIVEFINETKPSYDDVDIWHCFLGYEIDQIRYPHIYLWKSVMDNFMSNPYFTTI